MIEASEGLDIEVKRVEETYVVTKEGVHLAYPQVEEGLIDFLEICRLNDPKNRICPRCSTVCDKDAAREFEDATRYDPRRGRFLTPRFVFDKREVPR